MAQYKRSSLLAAAFPAALGENKHLVRLLFIAMAVFILS